MHVAGDEAEKALDQRNIVEAQNTEDFPSVLNRTKIWRKFESSRAPTFGNRIVLWYCTYSLLYSTCQNLTGMSGFTFTLPLSWTVLCRWSEGSQHKLLLITQVVDN